MIQILRLHGAFPKKKSRHGALVLGLLVHIINQKNYQMFACADTNKQCLSKVEITRRNTLCIMLTVPTKICVFC